MLAELLEWEFVAQLLVGKREIQKSTHLQWNAEKKVFVPRSPHFHKCLLASDFSLTNLSVIILVTHRRAS